MKKKKLLKEVKSWENWYERKISKAMEKVGLPKTKLTMRMTAEKLLTELREGERLKPKEAVLFVKNYLEQGFSCEKDIINFQIWMKR